MIMIVIAIINESLLNSFSPFMPELFYLRRPCNVHLMLLLNFKARYGTNEGSFLISNTRGFTSIVKGSTLPLINCAS